MYEDEFGTGSEYRIIYALKDISSDPERLAALASILCYNKDQLPQDIQALVCYYKHSELKTGSGQIQRNPKTGVCTLDGEQLHCGQQLKLLLLENNSPVWKTAYFEMDGDTPYLVGLPGVPVDGLFAMLWED